MTIRKNRILSAIYIIVPFVLFLIIDLKFGINFGAFSEPTFLFNYTGILLGFSITLYTFIVSQFSELKDTIKLNAKDNNEVAKKMQSLKKVYIEIQDDVWFIFICLILALFFYLVPEYLYEMYPDTKTYTRAILSTLFVLSLLSIKDLIGVSFKVAKFIGVNDIE